MALKEVISFILLFMLLIHVLRPFSRLVTSIIDLIWSFFVLLLSATLTQKLWRIWDRLLGTIDPSKKALLITGCDHGFGCEAALRLNKLGFHIFAGCLYSQDQGAVQLKKKASYSEKMEIIQLDVTNDQQIHHAYTLIADRLERNGLTLWGLLNNAGIFFPACLEFGRFEEEHVRVFKVNVFGVVKVTREFLPLIRKSRGRIVTMSSIACQLYYPLLGTYAMTKAAIRSFNEYLRHEVFPFGVKVISIEPSFARTPLTDSRKNRNLLEECWNNTNEEVKQAYGSEIIVQQALTVSRLAKSPLMQIDAIFNETLKAIIDAFSSYEPDIHYTVLPFCLKPMKFLKQSLPESLFFSVERFLLTAMLYMARSKRRIA